jgi:Predicted nucleotide-binding protein containing TIR-like domain
MLDEFKFALFVALPEDLLKKGGTEYHTVRDNVLFEMGLFLGHLGRERVFLIAPQGAGDAKLHRPTDLTGIQPRYFDTTTTNLRSAVSTSLLELKEAMRDFGPKSIFDSRRNLKAEHLVNKGGKKYDSLGKPTSGDATGNSQLTDQALEIGRTNSEGVWHIEVRPNGILAPTIPRGLGSERSIRMHFEAKVAGAEHNVRCVTADAHTKAWIDNRLFQVKENVWRNFSAVLSAPLNQDVLVRLQDELEHPPNGTLYLRNIVVTQVDS